MWPRATGQNATPKSESPPMTTTKTPRRPSNGEDFQTTNNTDSVDCQSEKSGVILGGSVRAMLLLLTKKISFKAMLRKRAFLTIGGSSDGTTETRIATKSPVALSHSRPVVYMEISLMGMAVFGTYDVIVDAWEARTRKHAPEADDAPMEKSSDSRSPQKPFSMMEMMDKTPAVAIHALAGSAAGVTRSLFWIGWEAVVHRSNWVLDHPKFCFRTTVHHSVGYGTLFGVYQGSRQSLMMLNPLSLFLTSHNHGFETTTTTTNGDETVSSTTTPIVITFISGGIAGQAHHALNHYTSHWKQFRSKIPPLPRLYPTATSFGTMALCFTAFEHSSDVFDGWIEDLAQILDDLFVK